MKKTILLITVFLTVNTFAQTNVSFEVDGACGMCGNRIVETAKNFSAVSQAHWDVKSKMLSLVLVSEFDTDQIQKAIAGVGHDTEKFKAAEDVYNELPGCCLYRDVEDHGYGIDDNVVHGTITEINSKGNKIPLEGANIYWENSSVGTVAGKKGSFIISKVKSSNKLTVSYAGYESKSVTIDDQDLVYFTFNQNKLLDEIVVTYRKKATSVSFLEAIKVQNINEEELQKAACCTLSESFETNPSVDVSTTDAVSGTRQIQMLGLAGSYVQVTRENMPDTRVISSIYGLTYTPGIWIESIQLNTGAGSVLNGFESITGQINVELKKPENSEKLLLNTYANSMGRIELNANFSQKINDNLSTAVLLHGSMRKVKWDKNEDGFLDNPTGDNLILLNRWKYSGDDNFEAQFGIKGVFVNSQGGQIDYDKNNPDPSLWASLINTQKIDAWGKLGKVINDKSSIGLQLSGTIHEQDANFGARTYDATQKSLYVNAIYQYKINEKNKLSTGLSFIHDNLDELVSTSQFLRNENVGGVFGEYTYKPNDKFTAIVGMRVDKHNNFGWFATPRMHLRYAFEERSVIRASVGRGQKTASIFAENIGGFASSRELIVRGENTDLPYGLNPEVSWNYGLSYSHGFEVNNKPLLLSVDYFFTDFVNQVVVDYDTSPQELSFYNLNGDSYSHSLQVQADWEIVENLDLRLAYRFNDVKSTYNDQLLIKPLVSMHRAFFNIAYETKSDWKFDATLNWQGPKRLPDTSSNPEEFRAIENSPSYALLNSQITKSWFNNKLDVYVGVENILDYRQENPIVSASDPYSPYFDASMIWGPVFGRNLYAGLRFKIE